MTNFHGWSAKTFRTSFSPLRRLARRSIRFENSVLNSNRRRETRYCDIFVSVALSLRRIFICLFRTLLSVLFRCRSNRSLVTELHRTPPDKRLAAFCGAAENGELRFVRKLMTSFKTHGGKSGEARHPGFARETYPSSDFWIALTHAVERLTVPKPDESGRVESFEMVMKQYEAALWLASHADSQT